MSDDPNERQCEACGYEATSRLAQYQPPTGSARMEPYWLCSICEGTHAGNWISCPSQADPETRIILQAISRAGNVILDAITKTR